MRKRVVLAIGTFFWMLALVAGSMLPEWAKVDLGTNIGKGHVFSFHRLVHLAAFGITSILLISIVRNRKLKLAAMVFVIGMGFTIECLEDRIYHCGFEASDVRDDTVAALLGYMFSRAGVIRDAIPWRPAAWS